jgi:hypothetical protein
MSKAGQILDSRDQLAFWQIGTPEDAAISLVNLHSFSGLGLCTDASNGHGSGNGTFLPITRFFRAMVCVRHA